MSEPKLCPFCGKSSIKAPTDCVCQSDTMLKMTRAAWNTRPIEDALRAELAAEKEQHRWVPVSERLPEVKVEEGHRVSEATVLVNWRHFETNEESENFNKERVEATKAFIYENHWINLETGEEVEIDDADCAPTHWMPMIKLPQGDQNAKS